MHNILVTHIPLHRPAGSDCGPIRERGTIRAGRGSGYQNTLSSEMSEFLTERIRPVLVFRYAPRSCGRAQGSLSDALGPDSGDDHDYCELQHQGGAREVTLKSFSMAMGVRKPGFQLLSVPEVDRGGAGAADRLCLLPDQIGIYLEGYLPLVALTLGVMIVDLVLMRKARMGSDRRADGENMVLPLHKVGIAKTFVDWWALRGLRRRKRNSRGLMGDFTRYFVDVAGVPVGAFMLISVVFMFGL